MRHTILALGLLISSLWAQPVEVGTSLSDVKLLKEETFPKPPFVMYFGASWSKVSHHNHEALDSLASDLPVFYVFVEDPKTEQAHQKSKEYGPEHFPVVIYDSYGGLTHDLGVEEIPTTLLIGEDYVVQEVFVGPINRDRVLSDLGSTPSI